MKVGRRIEHKQPYQWVLWFPPVKANSLAQDKDAALKRARAGSRSSADRAAAQEAGLASLVADLHRQVELLTRQNVELSTERGRLQVAPSASSACQLLLCLQSPAFWRASRRIISGAVDLCSLSL